MRPSLVSIASDPRSACHSSCHAVQRRNTEGGDEEARRSGFCSVVRDHPGERVGVAVASVTAATDPRVTRFGRAASEPDPAGAVLDEEQHVEAPQNSVSTVKKSHATMLDAWACKNSGQLGSSRHGAGPSRAPPSKRRTLVGEAWRPSFASSPQIRRCPQLGFSRPSRNTSSRISAESFGRPGLVPYRRHFQRTSD
jgi:hypothetical protein